VTGVPHLVYLEQMLEVKRRFLAVDRILGAKKPRTYSEDTDNEFMWLQLRRIVELISFSAIAADEARYAAKRASDGSNGDYRQDRRAGKILHNLQKISPHFLPQPMGVINVNPDGSEHIGNGASTQATLDRLKAIHENAGESLHAHNPFDSESEVKRAAVKGNSREQITIELAYLKEVIWDHYKIGLEWAAGENPQTLANSESAWLIGFGRPEAPDIKMMLAKAVSASSD
jgi:hypothetical protein